MKQPAPDVVVAGKYCLEGQLATGGMGSVWVARHLDLDVPVAIKFMGIETAASDEGRVRFEREAKAAAFLQSPHVVNVQDYGIDDGLPYIVMELLNGEDLKDRLHRQGRLSLEETLNILMQTSKALRRAQDLGIVHRDIKPENLFLATADDGDELVKVLDFGIAKETGPVLLAKGTNTGQIIGSPHYMSPEAVRGARDIDFRSDLWSLGVIIFECVTGRLPFASDNVGDVMGMILADPLPRATDVAPDLPVELNAFFDKALARDRAKRFQSARELTEAFAEIVRPGGGDRIFSRNSLTTPDPGSVTSRPASVVPAAEKPRPRRGAFAVAIALIAVLGVVLIFSRSNPPEQPVNAGPANTGAALQPTVAALPPATAAVTAQPRLPDAPTAAPSTTAATSASSVTTGKAATTAKGTAIKTAPSSSASTGPAKRPWGF